MEFCTHNAIDVSEPGTNENKNKNKKENARDRETERQRDRETERQRKGCSIRGAEGIAPHPLPQCRRDRIYPT